MTIVFDGYSQMILVGLGVCPDRGERDVDPRGIRIIRVLDYLGERGVVVLDETLAYSENMSCRWANAKVLSHCAAFSQALGPIDGPSKAEQRYRFA